MVTTSETLYALTARDLMSRNVVMVPRAMSLHTAAHLLSDAQVSGAPVVDEKGECVGVVSATDFMHWVGSGERAAVKVGDSNPGSYHSPWQFADVDERSVDEVGSYMTSDPVMVPPHTPIAELARAMTDAHIHRIVVVDALNRPIGVVSSTDVLAAVADAARRRL